MYGGERNLPSGVSYNGFAPEADLAARAGQFPGSTQSRPSSRIGLWLFLTRGGRRPPQKIWLDHPQRLPSDRFGQLTRTRRFSLSPDCCRPFLLFFTLSTGRQD